MASPAAQPPAKDAESTPLDILLNAITGTRQAYPYPNQTQQVPTPADLHTLGTDTASSESTLKRKRQDEPGIGKQSDVAKTISACFLAKQIADDVNDTSDLVSSIQLWHPRTAQKGYGKEKRLLNPPPSLRITGPIRDFVTDVTLSAIPVVKSTDTTTASSTPFSTQAHHIPLLSSHLKADEVASEICLFPLDKKAQREAKRRKIREEAGKHGFGSSLPWIRQKKIMRERQVLSDGLTFPGLWVGEEIRKDKEFQLELELSQTILAEGNRPSEGVQTLVNPMSDDSEQLIPADGVTPSMEDITAEDLEQIGQGAMERFVERAQPPDSSTFTHVSVVPDTTSSRTTTLAANAWGTFLSGPLTVISKPSQKTSRARSKSSCMTCKDNFALSVRINSQTVRTRYMKLEDKDPPRLASRTGLWSPFRFDILYRPSVPGPSVNTAADPSLSDFVGDGDVLTYGSVVSIIDCNSGSRSDPVKIVHVDKNEVIHGLDEGHPVSEMHRVGFVKWDEHDEGSSIGQYRQPRFYLSAPGARVGGGELLGHRYVPVKPKLGKKDSASSAIPVGMDQTAPTTLEQAADQTSGASHIGSQVEEPVLMKKKQRRTNRIALAKATLDEEDENSPTSGLSWHQAEGDEKEVTVTMNKNQKETRWEYVERVEDWMCWIITGVDCLSYTFVDQRIRAPSNIIKSIDVVPRVLSEPTIEHSSKTLDLLVHPFTPTDPLDVYLGSHGPLIRSLWSSTASRAGQKPSGVHAAVSIDDSAESQAMASRRYVTCSYPSDRPHCLLVVELPDMNILIRDKDQAAPDTAVSANDTLQSRDSLSRPEQATTGLEDGLSAPVHPVDPDEMDDSPWLAEHEHEHVDSGELTIQEALRNAEVALHQDLALANLSAAELTSSDFAMDAQGIEPITNDIPLDETPVAFEQHPEEENNVDEYKGSISTAHQALQMHRPAEQSGTNGEDISSLPIILVRRSDGVIFTTGWSVAMIRDEQGSCVFNVVADKPMSTV